MILENPAVWMVIIIIVGSLAVNIGLDDDDDRK